MPRGVYDHFKMRGKNNSKWVPRETRTCAAPGCTNTFECKVNSKRRYCCKKCGKKKAHKPNCTCGTCKAKRGETKGENNPFYGRKHTEETKEKDRQAQLGDKNPMKRPEVKVKHRTAVKEAVNRPEVKAKRRGENNPMRKPEVRTKYDAAMKEIWGNQESKEKQLRAMHKGFRVKPNKPEKFLTKLLQKLFPNQWKYVGDWSFIIDGKNPDFININGQKKIIEHFGDYHHGEGITGVPNEQHVQDRIDLFAKYGYQTLVIWEHELKDVEKLEKRIVKFSRSNYECKT